MQQLMANGAAREGVRAERDGALMQFVFDAPSSRNAIHQTQMLALRDMLRAAGEDRSIRVVALRGAHGHFCAGGAIGSFGDAPDGEQALDAGEKRERRIRRIAECAEISALLRSIPQPTVAILEGAAAGAGMIYALACDFRIASETAFFSTAYTRVGASGDMGAAALLLKLAGPHLARRLLFLSERLDAAEMKSLGLVTVVAPPEELESRASAILAELAAGPPLAFAAIKQNLLAAEQEPWDAAVRQEAENMVRTLESADCAEATRARREKRKPRFEGR